MEIQIDGVPNLLKNIDKLKTVEREFPYATSRALNDTADDVRNANTKSLISKFTVRTGWYKPRTAMGINVSNSDKRNLTAKVYTRAPWMALQEFGGIKTPKKVYIASPNRKNIGVANKYAFKQNDNKLPANILRKKNIFQASIGGKVGIWERLKDNRIKKVWNFIKSATIKKRWGFFDTANEQVKGYEKHFGQRLGEVMASIKLRMNS